MKIENTTTNYSFEYWAYNKKLFFIGSSIVTLECGITENIPNLSVEYKLNNKLLAHTQNSLEGLLKSRGHELSNCSLCLSNRYIHYMPIEGNNHIIGYAEYHIEPNEVEALFLNKFNEIIEEEQ